MVQLLRLNYFPCLSIQLEPGHKSKFRPQTNFAGHRLGLSLEVKGLGLAVSGLGLCKQFFLMPTQPITYSLQRYGGTASNF